MYKYRDIIRKVAIVDFDVHHGNGTEDIIKNLQKNSYDLTFGNENLDSGITFSLKQNICKPWLDFDDNEKVLFISLHGYDSEHPELFYPSSGSGQTNTVRGNKTYPAGILNIPIIGDNKYSPEFKHIFLNRVIPRLHKFKPDLIMISAGFDGHELEEMNLNYMKLNENDYRFMTEELTKIANKYCDGRIVSVLEGGYNINSGIVSSFAQSVMTHVKFLNIGANKFYYDVNNIIELNDINNLNSFNQMKLKTKRKREFYLDQANYRKLKKMKIGDFQIESDLNNNNNVKEENSITNKNENFTNGKEIFEVKENDKQFIDTTKIDFVPNELIKKKNINHNHISETKGKNQQNFLNNQENFIQRVDLNLDSDPNIYNLDSNIKVYNNQNLNLINNVNSHNFLNLNSHIKNHLEVEPFEDLNFKDIHQKILSEDITNKSIQPEEIDQFINLNDSEKRKDENNFVNKVYNPSLNNINEVNLNTDTNNVKSLLNLQEINVISNDNINSNDNKPINLINDKNTIKNNSLLQPINQVYQTADFNNNLEEDLLVEFEDEL